MDNRNRIGFESYSISISKSSLDVIKIYVELIKNNIPVILCDAELITKRPIM